jgi:hypothetical protein
MAYITDPNGKQRECHEVSLADDMSDLISR